MIPFEKLIKRFHEIQLEYVIVGGLAAVAHGSSYVTADLDLCYKRSTENNQKIVEVLKPLHPKLRGAPPNIPFQWDAKTLQAGLNFTLATDWGDIDLLGEIAGIGNYDAVFKQSEKIELFGFPCFILTLDALIEAKKAAGRKKDLTQLQELEALKELKKRR